MLRTQLEFMQNKGLLRHEILRFKTNKVQMEDRRSYRDAIRPDKVTAATHTAFIIGILQ